MDAFFTCPDCNERMPRARKMNHINKDCPAKQKQSDMLIPAFGLLLMNLLESDAYQSYISNSKDAKQKIANEKNSDAAQKMREMSKKIVPKDTFDQRFNQSIKNANQMKQEFEKENESKTQFVNGVIQALQVMALIDSLPHGEIQDPSKLQPGDKTCFLCKQNFQRGERIIILPCTHIFHEGHIANFLLERMCCPICSFLKEMNILINIVNNLG